MPLMAALSTSASLIPFNRISQGAKRWGNLFGAPKRCSFHSSISASKKGIIVVASSGGAFSSSQTETAAPPQRIYTWPDNRRPRVCILGGGFGGLYTALRLESLVWADDKKPQVLLVDQSERFVLFSNRCYTSFYLERLMCGKLHPGSQICLQALVYSFSKIK